MAEIETFAPSSSSSALSETIAPSLETLLAVIPQWITPNNVHTLTARTVMQHLQTEFLLPDRKLLKLYKIQIKEAARSCIARVQQQQPPPPPSPLIPTEIVAVPTPDSAAISPSCSPPQPTHSMKRTKKTMMTLVHIDGDDENEGDDDNNSREARVLEILRGIAALAPPSASSSASSSSCAAASACAAAEDNGVDRDNHQPDLTWVTPAVLTKRLGWTKKKEVNSILYQLLKRGLVQQRCQGPNQTKPQWRIIISTVATISVATTSIVMLTQETAIRS